MSDGGALPLVIDTNVALDLLVFDDPATTRLRQLLHVGDCRWLATNVMREELRRVLAYPQIERRLQARELESDAVLASWDALVHLLPDAPRACFRCKDVDDQKFIDLAVAHQALLLSKDKAVLAMARRLSRVGAVVSGSYSTPGLYGSECEPVRLCHGPIGSERCG